MQHRKWRENDRGRSCRSGTSVLAIVLAVVASLFLAGVVFLYFPRPPTGKEFARLPLPAGRSLSFHAVEGGLWRRAGLSRSKRYSERNARTHVKSVEERQFYAGRVSIFYRIESEWVQ